MKKYRIKETKYDNGTSQFQPQYFVGDRELELTKEMGYKSDGWIDIGSSKDTYRKALLRIGKHKKPTMRLVSVKPTRNIIEVIIHSDL